MFDHSGVHRRRFIVGAAGVSSALVFRGDSLEATAQEAKSSASSAEAVNAAKSKPLPAYVSWKDSNAIIVHSANTLETKREAIGPGLVTAAEDLFVPNNLPAPSEYVVASRATNAKGDTQPEDFEPHERAYGHNGWRAHAVDVKVMDAS